MAKKWQSQDSTKQIYDFSVSATNTMCVRGGGRGQGSRNKSMHLSWATDESDKEIKRCIYLEEEISRKIMQDTGNQKQFSMDGADDS